MEKQSGENYLDGRKCNSVLPELEGKKKTLYYATALDKDTYPFLLSSPPYSPTSVVLQHYMIKIPDTMWFNLSAILPNQFVMKHIQE